MNDEGSDSVAVEEASLWPAAQREGFERFKWPEPWPEIGEGVVYCDTQREDHEALVTAIHTGYTPGCTWGPCINLVYVSGDPRRQDHNGRQIERENSVSHAGTLGTAHGRYWRRKDETRKGYQRPLEV